MSLFDNLSDDTYVMVWRRDPVSKRMVYEGRLAPNEATEDVLLERLGGGAYQVRERVTTEDGAEQFGRSRRLEIGGPRKPNGSLTPPEVGRGIVPAASAPGPVGPADASQSVVNADLTRTYLELGRASREVMASRTDSAKELAEVFAPVFKQLAEQQILMVRLVEKLGDREPPPPPPTFQERMEEIRLMREIMAPPKAEPPAAQTSLKEHLETLRLLREASGEFDAGERKSDPMVELLPKVLEAVQAGLANRNGGAPMPPYPPMAPVPVPQPQLEATVVDPGEPLWSRTIREQGPKLIAPARDNRDPYPIFLLAWEYAKDDTKDALAEFLAFDDARDRLEALVPGLAPYRTWVDKFIETARETIFTEDEGVPADESPLPSVPPGPTLEK
jgi:hypothetical protein